MRAIAEKLRILEKDLAKKKGPFALFALFLREDAANVWDLVVAADWIEKDKDEALEEIAKRVQGHLAPEEIVKLSGVVIVDKANPEVDVIASSIAVEHGLTNVGNSEFFGHTMKQGFIITAQMPQAA